MFDGQTVFSITPALDEERDIGRVVAGLKAGPIDSAIVVDNGSRDGTAAAARAAGAIVVSEPERGYGAACLAGIAAAARRGPPGIVVFIDGDGCDDPAQAPRLLEPITEGGFDLAIGSRVLGKAEPGALLLQARYGNLLAVTLIHRLYGYRYTDLGPFRAIRWSALERLGMRDRNYGWTVEMQIKAVKLGLAVCEVPTGYHKRRHGKSKVAGTVTGTVRAGVKILRTIERYR